MDPRALRTVARRLGRFDALTFLVVAVAVFVLASAAVAFAPPDNGVAAWWPAAGLSAIAVAWAPRRRRVLMVVTIVVASGLANAVTGRALPVAAGFGLANATEAWVVAWWLTRDGRRPALRSLEDIGRFLVAVVLGLLVMGLLAGVTVALGDGGSFAVTARTVMASHAAALLVITPLGMRVLSGRAPGRHVEAAVQWVVLLAAVLAIFAPTQTLPLSFLTMPLLVWSALRLGMRTVTLQLVVLGVAVTWLSRSGGGPFAATLGSQATASVSLVQAYLASTALIALPLAVSVAQRRAALERVTASERLFRLGFSEALLGTLLLRRCDPDHVDPTRTGHRTRVKPRDADGPAPIPGADPAPLDGPARHAGGGLDVVELNAVAARIIGETEENLVGTSWTGRLEVGDRSMLEDAVAAMTAGELAGWHGELTVNGWDGRRWVEAAISPLPASAGEGLFVAQVVDATARRAAEDRLTAQALQDSLTGLGNRALLRDRIDLALRTLPDDGSGVALLYCDLDDFKHVNDSAGHTSGDIVLVEVADRIRGVLRPDDVAARPGGDEFVVLRPRAAGTEEAGDLAAQLLDALATPTVIGGRPFSIGASIGIAWGGRGARAEDLLRDADAAMYAAKAGGKRRAVVYSDEHRVRALRAVHLEADLREGLDRDELEVHMQPVVDLRTGAVVAAEALVRWRHPVQGLLGPAEWLDVAEDSGLMPRVGASVLEQACGEAARWPAGAAGSPPRLHVNVSARQLDEADFLATVHGVLERTGIPPEQLVLEFTETHLDAVSDTLLTDLAALRAWGIDLAADDYGTGYSPLTRIIELPISMIKIDRRFVEAMLTDVRSSAIVTTLVRLGDSLGLELVAEGVETEEQAAALRRLGCASAQGYLWSRPVPAEQFRESLRTPVSRRGSG